MVEFANLPRKETHFMSNHEAMKASNLNNNLKCNALCHYVILWKECQKRLNMDEMWCGSDLELYHEVMEGQNPYYQKHLFESVIYQISDTNSRQKQTVLLQKGILMRKG